MPFSSMLPSAGLTARSFAFILRNGTRPSGLLKVCRAHVPVAEEQYGLYRSLVQLETDRLEPAVRPQMVLNWIEVTDPDYRELQVAVRATYKGEERWYLHHILINNFIGWLWGLKDYGYNKYLSPLGYSFADGEVPLRVSVPTHDPLMRARFRVDPSAEVDEPEDDGSYSVKTKGRSGRLIYCSSSTSSLDELRNDRGILEVTENRFVEEAACLPYPTDWARLVPPGSYPATFFTGKARDVSMAPLQVLETW